MKNNSIAIALAAILILGACAPQATATTNPQDVQHTAEAAAFTMVAETQAAIPTNTPFPTETLTPEPTLTSIASPTFTSDPSIVNTPTGIPTLIAQQPTTSSGDNGNTANNCNKTLTEWSGPTALLNIVNETRPQGTVILSLYVVTEFGDCGYLADLSRGPIGTYSAGAFVTGREDFKVFGSFVIHEGTWNIVVRNNEIIAR